jgi:hypothetical protein
MMDFSINIYDKTALQRAWDEWCCDIDEPLVMHGGEFVAFMSWFLVNWLDHDEQKNIPLPPLSWKFRTGFEDKLSPVERKYLESVIGEPFSFFEVLEPKPGDGYLVRDVLTGREIYVNERSGSQGVRSGDMLFGRLAQVGDVAIFDAISEILFPPQWKTAVLELRQNIRKVCRIRKDELPTIENIRSCETPVRSLYRDFRDQALNPQAPQLVNTDGDPLSFNKVIFDIEDADEVFDEMYSLDFNDTREALLEDAKRDASGKIVKVEFPWLKKGNKQHKGMENTVLGHITIEKNRMSVDTNSLKRVEAIKKIVAKRCGEFARYRTTLIEPMEAKMKELHGSQKPKIESQGGSSQQDLMNIPEVKAQLQTMQRKHMESWIAEKIPALGNKTPVQAVKTREGREMVESLLVQFERAAGAMGDVDFELSLIRGVREKLGLV